MSKSRRKAWRMFLIEAYATNQGGTIEHCAYEADRLLAEYDKRFPEPVKDLTQESIGRRIAWMIDGRVLHGFVLEEKEKTFVVKPDYDPDAVTIVAKGQSSWLLPGRFTAGVPDDVKFTAAISYLQSSGRSLRTSPPDDLQWNEYIQQHTQSNETEADTHATT